MLVEKYIIDSKGEFGECYFSDVISEMTKDECKSFFDEIISYDTEKLVKEIQYHKNNDEFSGYIPQFSQFNEIDHYLNLIGNKEVTYRDFSLLFNENKKEGALEKFGELRLKFLCSIGLLIKKKKGSSYIYSISEFSILYSKLDESVKEIYLRNSFCFIGAIKYMLAYEYTCLAEMGLNLSDTTINRRKSDTSNILKFIYNQNKIATKDTYNYRVEQVGVNTKKSLGVIKMNDKDSFYEQISADIQDIKNIYSDLNRSDDYFFNHWILIKLFNFDEEVADEFVIDGSDKGIDSYIWFEDLKQLYLIQAKYYISENSKIQKKYFYDEFFNKGLNYLNNDNYKRSEELQNIFTKYKDDPEFTVRMQLYITKAEQEKENNAFDNYTLSEYKIDENSDKSINITKEIFWLSEIKNKYFGERITEHKDFEFQLTNIDEKTLLDINCESNNIELALNAKYILTPVYQLYSLVNAAEDKHFPLFSENIRDYIGNKGINYGIYKTLVDENDRANFFYYNNGVTIICDDARITDYSKHQVKKTISFDNPKIVNGAQTVNTIHKVLTEKSKKTVKEKLIDEFKNTFVMLKLLVVPEENGQNEYYTRLSEDIVKYNNSQNAISEKDFAANIEVFSNLQKDMLKYGILILVKQSDKNKFKDQYPTSILNDEFISKFDIDTTSRKNREVNLIDFLQIIYAFVKDGHIAKTKKQDMLKVGTDGIYEFLISFLKQDEPNLIHLDRIHFAKLIFFYKKAKEYRPLEDEKFSLLHIFDFLRRYIDRSAYNGDYRKFIDEKMDSVEEIEEIFNIMKYISTMYVATLKSNDDKLEFNVISKSKINENALKMAFTAHDLTHKN